MALDDFATFVNEEFGLVGGGGGTAEPAAGMGAASMFCSSKGGFGIGMQEAPYDVFLFLDGMASLKGRAVIATAPDIVRDSRDGRGGAGLMGSCVFMAPKIYSACAKLWPRAGTRPRLFLMSIIELRVTGASLYGFPNNRYYAHPHGTKRPILLKQLNLAG